MSPAKKQNETDERRLLHRLVAQNIFSSLKILADRIFYSSQFEDSDVQELREWADALELLDKRPEKGQKH